MSKYTTYQESLKHVKINGDNLKNVKDEFMTEELCMIAIKNSSSALQFIKNQSLKMCLLSVSKYAYNIKYVNDEFMTEELCMIVIKKDSRLLQFIKKQSLKMCLIVVENDGSCIEYINHEFMNNKIIKLSFENNECNSILNLIDDKFKTEEICLYAVNYHENM